MDTFPDTRFHTNTQLGHVQYSDTCLKRSCSEDSLSSTNTKIIIDGAMLDSLCCS